MVAPLIHFCLVFSFHNPFIIIADNPHNLRRESVDCNKLRRLTIPGSAITTLTTNTTKPTELTRLGGFVASKNLSN